MSGFRVARRSRFCLNHLENTINLVFNLVLALTDSTVGILENYMINESELMTHKGADILIVGSQLDEIQFLSKLLVDNNHKVRQGVNVTMAVAAIETTIPELILLSVDVSHNQNSHIIKDIELIRKICNVPVILWGDYESIFEQEEILIHHRLDYILKPFRRWEVLVKVDHQLQLNRTYQQMMQLHLQLQQEISDRQKAEQALSQISQELYKTTQQLEEHLQFDYINEENHQDSFHSSLINEWRRLAREKMPLSLILCEIDHFELYNRLYGYDRGMSCIQQIAQAIKQKLKRPADRITYFGQSKFAVILPNTNHRGVLEVAKGIRAKINQLQIPHEQGINHIVTLSLGVASAIPRSDLLPDAIVTIAQEAVDEAKHQGGDRIGVSVCWR